MKIEKALYEHFEEQINQVDIPALPIFLHNKNRTSSRVILKIAAAAIIILAFMPFIYRINSPSILATKAAYFCEYHDLNTRIPEGLLELKEIASYSLFSGGKK